MEVLTEEVYFYDTMQEAVDAFEIMRAERACDMIADFSPMKNGHVKLTIKVGEVRG